MALSLRSKEKDVFPHRDFSLQLVELWYVVQDGGDGGAQEQEPDKKGK